MGYSLDLMTPLQLQLQLAIKMISGGISEKIVVESLISVLSEQFKVDLETIKSPEQDLQDIDPEVLGDMKSMAGYIDEFVLVDTPWWSEEKKGW